MNSSLHSKGITFVSNNRLNVTGSFFFSFSLSQNKAVPVPRRLRAVSYLQHSSCNSSSSSSHHTDEHSFFSEQLCFSTDTTENLWDVQISISFSIKSQTFACSQHADSLTQVVVEWLCNVTDNTKQSCCSYSYFSICSLPDLHGSICAGRHTEPSTTGNIQTGNLQEGQTTQKVSFRLSFT